MSSSYIEMASLLIDLEYELRRFGLWSLQSPSEQALASELPFACDQLTILEWLQFVFLPKCHQLVEQELPLPTRCEIGPMVEEYCQIQAIDVPEVLERIKAIDRYLSQSSRLGFH